MAGKYNLPGVIVVGDSADFTLGSGIGERLGLGEISPQQRAHCPDAHRHGCLHCLPAQLEQPRGIGQAERASGA